MDQGRKGPQNGQGSQAFQNVWRTGWGFEAYTSYEPLCVSGAVMKHAQYLKGTSPFTDLFEAVNFLGGPKPVARRLGCKVSELKLYIRNFNLPEHLARKLSALYKNWHWEYFMGPERLNREVEEFDALVEEKWRHERAGNLERVAEINDQLAELRSFERKGFSTPIQW